MFLTVHAAVGSQRLLTALEELGARFVKLQESLGHGHRANGTSGGSAPPGPSSGLRSCTPGQTAGLLAPQCLHRGNGRRTWRSGREGAQRQAVIDRKRVFWLILCPQ